MSHIKRRVASGTFTHDLTPPGFAVRYVVSARRELTRDECFAAIGRFLRANAKPAAGACVHIDVAAT